jgi:hypothetical protein
MESRSGTTTTAALLAVLVISLLVYGGVGRALAPNRLPAVAVETSLTSESSTLRRRHDACTNATAVAAALTRVEQTAARLEAEYGGANLRCAAAHGGDASRVAALVDRALSGQNIITIVTAGGSSAAGAEMYQRAQLFSAQVATWLGTVLGLRARLLNMAVGGTASDYYAFCADQHLPLPVHAVAEEAGKASGPELPRPGTAADGAGPVPAEAEWPRADVILLEHCVNDAFIQLGAGLVSKAQFLELVVVTARRRHPQAVLMYACFPPAQSGTKSASDESNLIEVLRAHDVAAVIGRDLLNFRLPAALKAAAAARAARCPALRDVPGINSASRERLFPGGHPTVPIHRHLANAVVYLLAQHARSHLLALVAAEKAATAAVPAPLALQGGRGQALRSADAVSAANPAAATWCRPWSAPQSHNAVRASPEERLVYGAGTLLGGLAFSCRTVQAPRSGERLNPLPAHCMVQGMDPWSAENATELSSALPAADSFPQRAPPLTITGCHLSADDVWRGAPGEPAPLPQCAGGSTETSATDVSPALHGCQPPGGDTVRPEASGTPPRLVPAASANKSAREPGIPGWTLLRGPRYAPTVVRQDEKDIWQAAGSDGATAPGVIRFAVTVNRGGAIAMMYNWGVPGSSATVWLNTASPLSGNAQPGTPADARAQRASGTTSAQGGLRFRSQSPVVLVVSGLPAPLPPARVPPLIVYAATALLWTDLPPGRYIVCIAARSFGLLALAAA